ncbi:hypothetical protein EPUS_03793 [Endocarpon pusillum Z07020]|uniref:Uncharacterized protein n=1 Tax=Endocarpon pusillum (strain Z07020 / HMAS-L-300199) TaxID=1263415 RepID=U1HX30_ENDPU|nr:uncharacterized protein EPUS_03793 [Endocarpon pusillum Z07020]ERF73979.1 hypothetical protein EPUS_03793 [Endocarpon pusillum Z07020]
MNAKEFRAKAESGEVLIDSHDKMLRIAYLYSNHPDRGYGLWEDDGAFGVVEELHTRGWSFGQGDLRFNRTLDIFYLAQIATCTWRSTNHFSDDFEIPSADDFDSFYTQHSQLLNQDAWRQFYSPPFIAQATSARLYRMPDLLDLPDSSDPIAQPRFHRGVGHFTKLPRWAYNVARTRSRQSTLSVAEMTQIAISTLKQTISRLREGGFLSVQTYSETQARFWLEYMKVDQPSPLPTRRHGTLTDLELWDSVKGQTTLLEPDLDGTRKGEVQWAGGPDGGIEPQTEYRGFEPEVGSEEEIGFLAAVAAKETEGVVDMGYLDYTIRSHILLGVMRAAFESAEREQHLDDLKRGIAAAGRIEDETKAEQWIQKALTLIEPYVQKGDTQWPITVEDRSELLRLILLENGQLFARWKLSPISKEFNFELKARC